MNATKIIRDTAGNLYSVTDSAVDHCYLGTPVKKTKGGYAVKGSGRAAEARLVRKAGTTVVEA